MKASGFRVQVSVLSPEELVLWVFGSRINRKARQLARIMLHSRNLSTLSCHYSHMSLQAPGFDFTVSLLKSFPGVLLAQDNSVHGFAEICHLPYT